MSLGFFRVPYQVSLDALPIKAFPDSKGSHSLEGVALHDLQVRLLAMFCVGVLRDIGA
jgi:hypothetical protein